ncbi:hypothetical protein [Clostridium grantii]|uniref:Spore coat protein, CotS family n=1 Tax=Clostridium grantii DSM 8605 TaxID=1121316 RepID=A0A1M5XCW6_9CLOT|nr:hypothetical protein [Clostridium grantii]SHH97589.1 hypothetical protein SAMN02745207_03551 [Clostridium grantii DSM 8605]
MKNYTESLAIFLSEKNVKFEIKEKNKTIVFSDDLIQQLFLITEFHYKCQGYKPKIWNRMIDDRGTLVQDFSNKVKIVKRDILRLKNRDLENKFEEFLLSNSEENISKADKMLNIVEHKGYKQMIKRSMDRNEICLKEVYFTNIWNDNGIVIYDLKKSALDVYENDAIYLLSKLKRKGYKFDWDIMINKYCKNQNMDYFSENYINNMVNFPYDYIKSALKYFWISKRYKEVFSQEKANKYINKIYNTK